MIAGLILSLVLTSALVFGACSGSNATAVLAPAANSEGGSNASDAQTGPTASATIVALLPPTVLPQPSIKAKEHYDAGLNLWLQGRLTEAVVQYSQAIRLNPWFARAYAKRGRAYVDLREYREAVNDLDKAIRLDPKIASAYSSRGLAYWRMGQALRVLEDLTEALNLDPQLAVAYVDRGLVYGGLGQNQKAMSDFDDAVSADPNFALAYYNRAIAFTLLGNDVAARQDVEQAVQMGLNRGNLEKIINEIKAQR